MIDDLKEENDDKKWGMWAALFTALIFGHHENWFRGEYHDIKGDKYDEDREN